MKDLNALPDLCLRKIFSLLSLSDLLLVGHVCRRWEALQKSVACKRTSMTLLFGEGAYRLLKQSKQKISHLEKVTKEPLNGSGTCDSKWSHLRYDWLDRTSVYKLLETFPNISTLQISINDNPIWLCKGELSMGVCDYFVDHLLVLLNGWSQKMKTLNLCINFKLKNEHQQFLQEHFRLLHPLNNMKSLSNLTITFYSIFHDSPKVSFYLPVIGQLEHFYFECQYQMESIFDSLKQFANSKNLRQLDLGQIYSSCIQQDFFQQIDQQLSKQITRFPHLHFVPFDYESRIIRNFCSKFSSLQSITIQTEWPPEIPQLLDSLRPLENLIQLSIVTFTVNPAENDVIQEPIDRLPQLKSVKLLTISEEFASHTDLCSLDWPTMFPNIEILHYRNQFRSCTHCHNDNFEGGDRAWIICCLKLALKPWKLCQKLKTIYASDKYEEIEYLKLNNFDEL